MNITDELRKYAESECTRCGGRKDLLHIADRIDVTYKHAIGYVDNRDSETMAENGWGRLPKDANGKYIHIGDIMEWPSGETFEVIGVGGIGGDTLFYIDNDDSIVADWTKASNKRHHKKTVEDMLFEMYDRLDEPSGNDSNKTLEEIITEYAAKLQLKEE